MIRIILARHNPVKTKKSVFTAESLKYPAKRRIKATLRKLYIFFTEIRWQRFSVGVIICA